MKKVRKSNHETELAGLMATRLERAVGLVDVYCVEFPVDGRPADFSVSALHDALSRIPLHFSPRVTTTDKVIPRNPDQIYLSSLFL